MSDGFTLVTSKSKRKKGGNRCNKATINFLVDRLTDQETVEPSAKQVALITRKIDNAFGEIIDSLFFVELLTTIDSSLKIISGKTIHNIVCFGLGVFSISEASRYQLAVLSLLKKFFKAKVLIHDPLFGGVEIQILKSFGFDIIHENEEGKHLLSDSETTLVYAPHCPHQLINNLLWKNWSPVYLKNSIILCNNLSELVNSKPGNLDLIAGYISKIEKHIVNLPVNNNFKYPDIFNNLSVHVVDLTLIKDKADFWIGEEPIYECDQLDIITKSIIPCLVTE